MRFDNLKSFLRAEPAALAKGPVALIFIEDEVEIASTLRHHIDCGFGKVIAFAPAHIEIPNEFADEVRAVSLDFRRQNALFETVNSVIAAATSGVWRYYCYNAEYLFFPFCEHRTVGELVSFVTEERRDAVMTYVIDHYAGDLQAHPSAVDLKNAHLDRSGYYALSRTDRWNNALERQMDFFGGLRWRFEEHIPANRRRIDRISLFRAQNGLTLRPDFTLSEPEMNTYQCPWHNNTSAAICSFRTAKALKRNPGSTYDISTFTWYNSVPFTWHSQQLLDLGLMEPGQWF